jgi:hypothetical protein
MTTRTHDVTNDVQNPLRDVTVTVAGGARHGSFRMYEDNGTTTDLRHSVTTQIRYLAGGPTHAVHIQPAAGTFAGEVAQRQWTVTFMNASPPTSVLINGRQSAAQDWSWDAATHTLTVTAPAQSVHQPLEVSYR